MGCFEVCAHRHTQRQTRHTDTQTHRHTHTHRTSAHRHRHTDARTHTEPHTHTDTHTHTQHTHMLYRFPSKTARRRGMYCPILDVAGKSSHLQTIYLKNALIPQRHTLMQDDKRPLHNTFDLGHDALRVGELSKSQFL